MQSWQQQENSSSTEEAPAVGSWEGCWVAGLDSRARESIHKQLTDVDRCWVMAVEQQPISTDNSDAPGLRLLQLLTLC